MLGLGFSHRHVLAIIHNPSAVFHRERFVKDLRRDLCKWRSRWKRKRSNTHHGITFVLPYSVSPISCCDVVMGNPFFQSPIHRSKTSLPNATHMHYSCLQLDISIPAMVLCRSFSCAQTKQVLLHTEGQNTCTRLLLWSCP
jgi:hypothetical protein